MNEENILENQEAAASDTFDLLDNTQSIATDETLGEVTILDNYVPRVPELYATTQTADALPPRLLLTTPLDDYTVIEGLLLILVLLTLANTLRKVFGF